MTKSALKNSTHLSTALLCGENGLRVVPLHGLRDGRCTCGRKNCKQPGRHPRIDDATSNPAIIKKHWGKWPQAKIGARTGAPDMIALILTGNDGLSALKQHGTLAKTVEFRAGKFRTYLWKAPADAIPDGTVRIAKGVIVRGRGKYVILPNDLKAAEGRHFVSGRGIGQTDIAPAPDWLLTSIGRRQKGSSAKAQATTSWDGVTFNTRAIDVDWIVDGGEPCDPKKVKRLADSYTVTGPRTPPVVRLLDQTKRSPGKNAPEYAVLSDRHQIEALKSLGAKTIDCIVADTDEKDACLWQGGELFHRREATFLDRAEVVVNCLRRIRSKAGRTPTFGRRRQPHDKGYSAAEKLLGVSRRDLRRLEKIAGICREAKKEARRAKLDNVLEALLDIADEPAERQVKKVRELAEDYAGGRRKPSGSAKPNAARRPATRTEPRKADRHAEGASNGTKNGADSSQTPLAVKGTSHGEGDSIDPEPGTENLPVPEDDGGIPSFLRRADEEKIKAKLQKIYDNYLAPEWPGIPLVFQCWFVTDLLGIQILNIGKEETRH